MQKASCDTKIYNYHILGARVRSQGQVARTAFCLKRGLCKQEKKEKDSRHTRRHAEGRHLHFRRLCCCYWLPL